MEVVRIIVDILVIAVDIILIAIILWRWKKWMQEKTSAAQKKPQDSRRQCCARLNEG